MSNVTEKLQALRAKQEEADRLAAEKAAELQRQREEREMKAAARKAAETALISAAFSALEAEAPTEVSVYAALAEVTGVMSETAVKTFLERWATENEVDASAIISGKARTGKWNGRFDRAAVMYQLGLEAVGAAPATFNQNLYRLKAGEVPGDPRSKADQAAEWEHLDAIVKAIPAKSWESVVKAIDAAFAAGEKAATPEEVKAA